MKSRDTMRAWRIVGLLAAMSAPVFAASQDNGKPVQLDHVIAVVNGEVLLESDVRQEMNFAALEPLSVPAGQNTPMNAALRLTDRALILQQIKAQQQNDYVVTDAQVEQNLADLRKQVPECVKYHCTTEDGWQEFLRANHLTEKDVLEHWRQRLEILHFIDMRFGSGIRIPRTQIQDYYQKNLVPQFTKLKKDPPPLNSVQDRIREILVQQQVNLLLRDWLKSLHEQGTIQILDPVYGQSFTDDDDSGDGA